MSQPELNDMEIIFQNTIDKDIKIIGLFKRGVKKSLAEHRDLHGNIHCGN